MKYDGYRMLARCEGGIVRLVSRNGNDWTARLAPLAADDGACEPRRRLARRRNRRADASGRTSFQALQRALDGKAAGIVYYVFDLLHADGEDLRALPLRERCRASEAMAGVAARATARYA